MWQRKTVKLVPRTDVFCTLWMGMQQFLRRLPLSPFACFQTFREINKGNKCQFQKYTPRQTTVRTPSNELTLSSLRINDDNVKQIIGIWSSLFVAMLSFNTDVLTGEDVQFYENINLDLVVWIVLCNWRYPLFIPDCMACVGRMLPRTLCRDRGPRWH